MELILVLLLALNLGFTALVYFRLSRYIHDGRHEVRRILNNAFVQIEGLMSVHAVIKPRCALPRSRGWAASPDMLQVLLLNAQRCNPRQVLECSSGLSTMVLAAWMRNAGRGHVFSLEHDPTFAQQTRDMLQQHELSQWATVINAPLAATSVDRWQGPWYELTRLKDELKSRPLMDMLVVDGPPNTLGPMARYPALPVLNEFLAAYAVVVVDDSDRLAEKQMLDEWRTRYPDFENIWVPECEKGCVVLERTKQGSAESRSYK